MPNGTLENALKEKSLSGTQKYIILLGVAFGLKYLNSQNIFYENLQTSNVFLDINNYPHISDFIQHSTNSTHSGNKKIENSNISSFGSVAYQIITGNCKKISLTSKEIPDQEILQFLKLFFVKPSKIVSFDEIINEITKERYMQYFNSTENDIFNYLRIFDINEISEKVEVDSICYIIKRMSHSAQIIQSPVAKGSIRLHKDVEWSNKKYEIDSICDNAFCNASITSLIFSQDSKIKSIGNYAFSKSKLRKLFIPASVEKIEANWLSGAENLIKIDVDRNNKLLTNEHGIIIQNNQESKEIIFVQRDLEGELIVPVDIKRIKSYSFYKCKGILTIVCDSPLLESIETHSFYQCEKLNEIKITRASLLEVFSKSFCENLNLKKITIESNEIKINSNWITNCQSLESISFKTANDLHLRKDAFEELKSLVSISIESKSIIVDEKCFYEFENLQSVSFACSDLKICEKSFRKCSKLTSVSFSNIDNAEIDIYAFSLCTSITQFNITATSKLTIKYNCFEEAKLLRNVKFIGADLRVSFNIFDKCKSLKYVYFKSSKYYFISDKVFDGCLSHYIKDFSQLKKIQGYYVKF